MSLQLDLANEWRVWDGLEGAVLKSRRLSGDWNESPITAKRRKVNYKEMVSSNGVYVTQDRVWLVPAVLVDTGPIKSRDQVIEDNQTAWTVLDAELDVQGTVWRLVTRNLIIAADLQDLITIQTPTITYDAAGGPLKSWAAKVIGSTIYQNLPCRVQPVTGEIVEERGMRGIKLTHIIPVAQDLVLTNDDRVKVVQANVPGAYLEIRGWTHPQEIQQLFEIEAELMP